jgi:hypothetical protein
LRKRSLARAREGRIEYKKGMKSRESDGEWSAGQEEETLTLTEPVLSGSL